MMVKMSKILPFLFSNLIVCFLFSQNLTLDGYAFESGNRGFLNVVQVTVLDKNGTELGTTFSDLSGHFEISVPARFSYKVVASKDMFQTVEREVKVDEEGDGNKIFMKLEMERAPGYMFEITLAEKREHDSIVVDAIKYSRIEVYNNTTKKDVLVLENHPDPHFEVALQKGNHYTILVRKDGYLGKRMEAFVNVEGCILCFEGIGSITPGVSDNLSEGNQMGVLLANVELDKIYEGKTIPISNILYEFGKADLKKNDEEGLQNLATIMKDNPDLTVEIGSHTDSRGKQGRNMELSQERAQGVVDFLIDHGVSRSRLISRGYGESQLKNKCDSYTDCTEAQHRINRRTELKVLGISNVKAPIKTLAQIKQMEQGEALLDEIQFGGQIQIPIDSTEISEQVDTNNEKVAEYDVEDQIREVLATDEEKEEITQQEVVTEATEEEIEEITAKQPEESKARTYRIVIQESASALTKDSDLYNRHSSLVELKNGDSGFIYMIGEYNDERGVQTFYKTVKIAYPDSYPVFVEGGQVTKL